MLFYFNLFTLFFVYFLFSILLNDLFACSIYWFYCIHFTWQRKNAHYNASHLKTHRQLWAQLETRAMKSVLVMNELLVGFSFLKMISYLIKLTPFGEEKDKPRVTVNWQQSAPACLFIKLFIFIYLFLYLHLFIYLFVDFFIYLFLFFLLFVLVVNERRFKKYWTSSNVQLRRRSLLFTIRLWQFIYFSSFLYFYYHSFIF